MSRIINPESAGKQRTQLSKAIVLAVRELARQKDVSAETRDLASFIAMALQVIADGIEVSVTAWEKRDYWIKADKFRMEWMWAGQLRRRCGLPFCRKIGAVSRCCPPRRRRSWRRSRSAKIIAWGTVGGCIRAIEKGRIGNSTLYNRQSEL